MRTASWSNAELEVGRRVAGGPELLDGTHRGLWHFSIWLMASAHGVHTAPNVLVDLTDPQHPIRRYADSC
ncbi:hypothetical protein Q9R19_12325 [Microbacterium sp. ARD32]|uniref:hypothetical protein n=1 Tax=Microbacterium sp. ARD32 TaxID=2962577 RepID=UPI002880F19F|nr:hypothetical protein [Microbacterium sp. ARD32]MDT0158417.1 hypothetical protein [Microbacterium sp. ARD32]